VDRPLPDGKFFCHRSVIGGVMCICFIQKDSAMANEITLASRLTKIEREVRFWRILGMVTLGCIVIAVTLGANANPQTPSVLKAKEFQLVDDDGAVRATLKTIGNESQLTMNDGSRASEVTIATIDTTASIKLTNGDPVNSARLEASESGGSIYQSRKTQDGMDFTKIIAGKEGQYHQLKRQRANDVSDQKE